MLEVISLFNTNFLWLEKHKNYLRVNINKFHLQHRDAVSFLHSKFFEDFLKTEGYGWHVTTKWITDHEIYFWSWEKIKNEYN